MSNLRPQRSPTPEKMPPPAPPSTPQNIGMLAAARKVGQITPPAKPAVVLNERTSLHYASNAADFLSQPCSSMSASLAMPSFNASSSTSLTGQPSTDAHHQQSNLLERPESPPHERSISTIVPPNPSCLAVAMAQHKPSSETNLTALDPNKVRRSQFQIMAVATVHPKSVGETEESADDEIDDSASSAGDTSSLGEGIDLGSIGSGLNVVAPTSPATKTVPHASAIPSISVRHSYVSPSSILDAQRQGVPVDQALTVHTQVMQQQSRLVQQQPASTNAQPQTTILTQQQTMVVVENAAAGVAKEAPPSRFTVSAAPQPQAQIPPTLSVTADEMSAPLTVLSVSGTDSNASTGGSSTGSMVVGSGLAARAQREFRVVVVENVEYRRGRWSCIDSRNEQPTTTASSTSAVSSSSTMTSTAAAINAVVVDSNAPVSDVVGGHNAGHSGEVLPTIVTSPAILMSPPVLELKMPPPLSAEQTAAAKGHQTGTEAPPPSPQCSPGLIPSAPPPTPHGTPCSSAVMTSSSHMLTDHHQQQHSNLLHASNLPHLNQPFAAVSTSTSAASSNLSNFSAVSVDPTLRSAGHPVDGNQISSTPQSAGGSVSRSGAPIQHATPTYVLNSPPAPQPHLLNTIAVATGALAPLIGGNSAYPPSSGVATAPQLVADWYKANHGGGNVASTNLALVRPLAVTSSGVAFAEDTSGAGTPAVVANPPGTNVVAIDNKIEQAMDLVKTHLMYAVREEVEVLKDKIVDLERKVSRLEWENQILREHAAPEVLAQIQQAISGGSSQSQQASNALPANQNAPSNPGQNSGV